MKTKFFFLLIVIFCLFGCGKTEKFYLETEHYEKAAITEIDAKKLKELENKKKNFAIFVYLPGCISCAEFKEVLTDFSNDKEIEFYSISINDVEGTLVNDKVTYAPSLVLYNDGKVVDYLDSVSDKDKPYFKSTNGLQKWLEEYIYLSK